MRLGAHMSIAGGVHRALERGLEIGCETIQIFVKNNLQWFSKPIQETEVSAFNRLRSKYDCIQAVFGHSGYLINLGAPDSVNRKKSLASLVHELERSEQLKLPFLVIHPGAHLGEGLKAGIKRVVAGLSAVLKDTRGFNVRIALENTAGQGTSIGSRIEQLAEIFGSVRYPERLRLCLDTAHFFAAGFDIRNEQCWAKLVDKIDRLIGVPRVVAFHLNDSKTDVSSKVDRHEAIGHGRIGLRLFERLVNDTRFDGLPGCIETPKTQGLQSDSINLKTLRSLMRRPVD
ncbi:MAG: deoxyribonuclease IV [Verrucomicrobia bacterium]|nr:deoxyribonuclease IV [Verrucomicrobiota bacterium]